MLPRPTALSSDTYTSTARTPWAGTRLSTHFGKRPLGARIGESWELSLGPELPSRTRAGSLLSTLVDAHREGWLGAEPARSAGLLVKLLDADAPLSLQIHPRHDDPSLSPNESGKPEAWYVARAERGAWIAFGWKEGVGPENARAALRRADGSLATLLQRVEVVEGDVFVVDAGTPHAIGPGVTLVEPQFIAPGKLGVTYRYWDWERRYDPEGRLDPSGSPRPLHVERALEVTNWSAAGTRLLERAFRRCGPPSLDSEPNFELLVARARSDNSASVAMLPSDWLRIERIAGTGTRPWPRGNSLHALTVLHGSARLLDARGLEVVSLGLGETAAIPACHEDLWIQAERLCAVRTGVEP